MKVARKSIGSCRLQLTIQAEAAETRDIYQEVQQRYFREGRVPGFRQGKAPLEVIMRHYANAIDADAQDQLVRKFYREALREEGIEPVAVLNVDEIKFSAPTGIRFNVQLDVPPEFKLPKYKGLSLKDETRTITDAQVDERLERIQGMLARYEEDPEHAVTDGDMACVTYTAQLDGAPLAEQVDGTASRLASAEDAWLQADANSEVPGLGTALKGMKTGEQRDVKIDFPKDFGVGELAGKTADYHLKVSSVRRRQLPPLDKDFFAKLGMEDEASARKTIRDDLENEAQRAEAARRREEVARLLLKKTRFDLPQSVVEEEVRMTLQSMIQNIMSQGGDPDTLKSNRDALMQSAQESSEERVRLNYIMLAIATAESVEVSEADVDQRIDFLAARNRTSSAKLREQLEQHNALERLSSEIRAQKAMDLVLSEAKIG